jgi:DnaJ-class molecular chaperone
MVFLILFWTPVLVLVLGFLIYLFFRGTDSHFKSREFQNQSTKAQQTNRKSEPLRLEGFRFDQEPHQILGIQESATESMIQDAYRKMMKRFHPDKVGSQNSAQWQEAQSIAHALSEAKNKMMKKVKKNRVS